MRKYAILLTLLAFVCTLAIFAQRRNVDEMLSAPHKPNSLMVRFVPGTTQAEKDLYFLQLNAVKVKAFKIVPDLYAITLPNGTNLQHTLTWLLDSREVMYAEPNYRIFFDKTPNDPQYANQWHLPKIKAPEAWDQKTDADLIIAVLDTGINTGHEDLVDNLWVNETEANGEDDTDDDGNGYIDDINGINIDKDNGEVEDDDGHGSHVSGIFGAVANNAKGVSGICWKIKIMALRLIGDEAGIEDAAEGMEYAMAYKVKVLNMSFGYTALSQSHLDAIRAAQAAGMVCSTSAGNSAADNDVVVHYPSDYGADYDLDNVVAVAASDENDALADFSNYGVKSVHIMAPGVDILSTTLSDRADNYETMSGTSMASPCAGGAVALLWAIYPTETHSQILGRIYRNVDKVSGRAVPVKYGGRINLLKAIVDQSITPDDFGKGSGGCSSYPSQNWHLSGILPYLVVLMFAVWKGLKIRLHKA